MPAVETVPLRNAWSMKVLVASGLGFLIDDDGVEFGGALGVDEGAPLLVDLVIRGDAVN